MQALLDSRSSRCARAACGFADRARAPGTSRRRGMSIVYVGLILVVLIAFVSLAVDVGRIRLARAELQTAADASAHSAARALPLSQSAVEDAAVEAAASNRVIDADNQTGGRINPGVELYLDEDLEVGIWNRGERTFTALEDLPGTTRDERRAANAVFVEARRIGERQNPIPLIFAPVLGILSHDVERRAIAYVTGGPSSFAFVGIDWVRANGNLAIIDGPDGRTSNASGGGVASNGDIDLRNADVYGDVRPGIDGSIITRPNTTITGWAANLDYVLDYPVTESMPEPRPPVTRAGVSPPVLVDTATGTFDATGNSNGSFQANRTYYFKQSGNKPAWIDGGSGRITINGPATIYLDGDFSMTGSSTLDIKATVQQPVRFIVNGNFDQSGGNILNSGAAGSLQIRLIKPNTYLKLSGNTATKAHIYAPVSDVTINGTPDFTGWIIGKTLRFVGTSQLHYDDSFPNDNPFKVTIVR